VDYNGKSAKKRRRGKKAYGGVRCKTGKRPVERTGGKKKNGIEKEIGGYLLAKTNIIRITEGGQTRYLRGGEKKE